MCLLIGFAFLSVFLVVICLAVSPYRGVVILMATYPIVAMTWKTKIWELGLLDLVGVAVPVLLIPRLLKTEMQSSSLVKWRRVAVLYLLANAVGVILPLAEVGVINRLDNGVRALNGFVGFLMFPMFFYNSRRFRTLLTTILISGAAPCATGIWQAVAGTTWQPQYTVGLTRNVGLYHDLIIFRVFGFTCLLAILLIFAYWKPRRRLIQWGLITYGVIWLIVIFHLYSKAAILILVLWCVIWCFLRKKLLLGCTIVLAVLALNWATESKLSARTESLFTKEIAVVKGEEEDPRRLLSGRGFRWEKYMRSWLSLNLSQQLLGTGRFWAVHNELLRILILNGIIGLTLYIVFLGIVARQLLTGLAERITPIRIVAVMLYMMWLVDCVGIHPGRYPYGQWIVWGIIGCAINGVRGLDTTQGTQLPIDGWFFGQPTPQLTLPECDFG